MSVSGISSGAQLGTLEELMRKQAEKQAGQLDGAEQASRPASVTESVKASNSGVMAANFASADSEMSRYVEARHLSAAEMQSMKHSVSAQIWAAADRLGGIQGRSRQYIEREELRQSLNENNKEIRDDIERKAQEAQAPKDAEGNPIQVGTSSTAPAPEIASSAPASSAPDAAPQVTIDAPQVSIDLTV